MEQDLLRQRQVAEDHALLVGMQAGEEAALEALYARYGGLVYTRALHLVGDRDLAAEVLQDVFLRCWQGAASYDPARGHVAGWLMRITRNRTIDIMRGRQHQARLREQALSGSEVAPRTSGDADPGESMALRELITDAFAALPPRQRRPLELALFDGLTQVEIAGKLDEPLGTVKSRMLSGLRQLRHHLRPWVSSESGERGRRG